MPPKPIIKMSKTFDQAVYDATAIDLYSARNIKFNKLEDLIDEFNFLKSQTTYSRTAKAQYFNLKDRCDAVITELTDDNKALGTALFKINPKIQEDARYKEDQKVFRDWIKSLENANLDLKVKLEDEGVIPTRSIMEEPPATSDLNTILQQMDKRWSDSQKQLGKQFSDSQKQLGKQFLDFPSCY